MDIHFTASPDLEAFAQLLNHADQQGYGLLLVFACDGNDWPATKVNALIAGAKTTTVGGIFPGISLNAAQHEHGALIVGLKEHADLAVIQGMSDPEAHYESQLLDQVNCWDSLNDDGTLFVLVDGLSSRISSLVEGLFFVFGLDCNFVGGGAGSLSFEQKPCIITPHGLASDAALIFKLPRPSTIGVTHGWSAISDALEVTEADRNVVKSLNWEPAFEAYKKLVDAHSANPITREAFFDTAKSYPLGLQKIDSEIVVRDPLFVQDDQHLVCVGEVPQGAFVRVLNGDRASLLDAACRARDAINRQGAEDDGFLILFDCISRVLFLGADIENELRALVDDEASAGAFTLGEIANSGRDYLEFLNKTTVLARIGKASE